MGGGGDGSVALVPLTLEDQTEDQVEAPDHALDTHGGRPGAAGRVMAAVEDG